MDFAIDRNRTMVSYGDSYGNNILSEIDNLNYGTGHNRIIDEIS